MFFESKIFLTKWQALPAQTRKKIAMIIVTGAPPAMLGVDNKAWAIYREIIENTEATKEWLKTEWAEAT